MLDDKKILKQLKNNNQQAIRFLFDKYYELLHRSALKYVHKSEIAEEIVDDIFVNIWKNREKLEIKTTIEAYLYASVRYGALNYIRDNKKVTDSIEDMIIEMPEKTSPADKINEEELSGILKNAINSLPEKCRLVFSMSRNSNYTYKQIANELDVSVKTIENQMSIALKRLREYVADYYGNP